MIALIRKELKELSLAAVALVACAAVISGMELLYSRVDPRFHEQGLALSIWLVISLAIAFLGGAAAIARENRSRLIFLTSWPQSRLKLWLVKAGVSFVLTVAVAAVGFGICLAALQLTPQGGSALKDSHDAVVALSWILPLCFALGLLWSGVIGSVLGAGALGLATGGA